MYMTLFIRFRSILDLMLVVLWEFDELPMADLS